MVIKTKKILVSLDDSKNSIRGLDMAIHLTRQSHGTITALAVKSVLGIYAIHPLGFLDFDSMKEVKKFLNDAKVRAAKKGIQLTAKALAGDPGYDLLGLQIIPKTKLILLLLVLEVEVLQKRSFWEVSQTMCYINPKNQSWLLNE